MGRFAVMRAGLNTRRAEASHSLENIAQDDAKSAMLAGYLCAECVQRLGGSWPRGHRATFLPANCQVCRMLRPLACWSGWNWPKAAEADAIAKKRREV